MIPLPERFLASCYIETNDKAILIDCGEGTQISFRKTDYDLSKLEIILITHCHADHILGLPGILLTLGNYLKSNPLFIVGPQGIKNTVMDLMTVCKYIPYEIKFIELKNESLQNIDFENIKITSIPLFHPISCAGYSINFCNEKLKISYCTDTRPTEYMSIIENSDLFVCEGMYGSDDQYSNAVRKRHMLFSEAAQVAKKYNIKELWLTHFSQNIKEPEEFIHYANNIFLNTKVGKDLMKKVF